MAPSSADFYRELEPFHGFVHGIFEPRVYRPLPPEWVLLVADIAGSTRAVEGGRYAEVNYLGAACVVAVNNALGGLPVPTSFGGDGATLAVPATAREAAVAALLATRRWGREAFALELRVGAVPVADLYRRGHVLEVAKLEFSPGNAMAMFRGDGFDAADRLVKDDGGGSGYRIAEAAACTHDPDLRTLSCRWAPLASQGGVMLCLIVAAHAGNLAGTDAIYREALARIDAIAPLESAATNPVKLASLRSSLRLQAIRREASHTPGPRWRRSLAVLARHLAQLTVFRLGLRPGGFDPDLYRREMTLNADFRRLAGTLRLILDCTPGQADAIEATLDELHHRGLIFHGVHRTRQALITCVTPNVDNHEHVHYIDGTDGGLYSAARRLKERMAGAASGG